MNLVNKTKNFSTKTNISKNQLLGHQKQIKKIPGSIKLEVNKLLKNQSIKSPLKNSQKSLFISQHYASIDLQDRNRSKEKENLTKNQSKITKTFEELYFQKIKQLKTKQATVQKILNMNSKVAFTLTHNIASTKENHKLADYHRKLTKNCNLPNKENIQFQNLSEKISIPNDQKYLIERKYHDQSIMPVCSIDHKIQGIYENKNFQPKIKRILRLKKTNTRTKSSDISQQPQIQKKVGQLSSINYCIEKPLLSPLNSLSVTSQDLRIFKLSTPLSSSSLEKYSTSCISVIFQGIIDNRIDHSQHEHIWGGDQCFFSYLQFQLILKELGFDKEINKEVGFYVKKMWHHLGGDLFGGVVKKNMLQFLGVILEDQIDKSEESQKNKSCQNEIQLNDDFIHRSSLRLIHLSCYDKDQIRKFYFPLKMAKIASSILNLIDQNELQNPQNPPNSLDIEEQKIEKKIEADLIEAKSPHQKFTQLSESLHLQNIAYLESISVKNRQLQTSPQIIESNTDSASHNNFVTDFSPRMLPQQIDSFKSTILQKQSEVRQKLSTQLQPETYDSQTKSHRKPLLSVDINIGEGIVQKIVVYQDQSAYEVSYQLQKMYNIDEETRQKFELLLKNHMKNLLFKIEEVSEELFDDSIDLGYQCFDGDLNVQEKTIEMKP